MVNYQAFLKKALPDSVGRYGFKATWVGPNGIQRVSDNIPGTGAKWATAGNIVAYLTGGGYVEASITYITSGVSGQSAGWKFWRGYNGVGTYQSLTNSPVSKSVGLTLKKVGTTWRAIYNNWTNNETYDVAVGNGAPDQLLANTGTNLNRLMIETAQNSNNCTYFDQFVQIDFSNVKYLDSSGNPTSQVPAAAGYYIITAYQGCLGVNESLEKIIHL